ncbi:MAG: SPFH domain-containing protein, partial [Acidobacteriota bacterium]
MAIHKSRDIQAYIPTASMADIAFLLIVFFMVTAVFQVDQTEFAVVTQFGQPVRSILEPGLKFKWPGPFQSVIRFDNRLQMFETPAAQRRYEEFLTLDKKNVLVGTYTVWRIAPDEHGLSRFLETVRDLPRAEIRLADLVAAELGVALGNHEFAALVTTDRDQWQWPDIVQDIGRRCREAARRAYGIEIVDFQIARLSFPTQNRVSVFERMREERRRIAAQYRAEGDKEARKITATA